MIDCGIPFLDLHPGEDAGVVREAIQRVLTRGWFILGPEVDAFESEFASMPSPSATGRTPSR